MRLQSPIKLASKSASVPARKTPQGNSGLSATGLADAPKMDLELGSSRQAQIQELVPELLSPFSRAQVYNKMMNDAGVDVAMRVWKTPILGAEYFVDPYSDDPADMEVAEFIGGNLFDGMNSPFINSIEDILHFCEDGYSTLFKVYEQREWTPRRAGANSKTYTMLKKLAYRPASTIKSIEYDDNGGPVKVVQSAMQADGTVKDVDLDISQLMIFTLNRKGGDLQGKSLLRTAYPHWYYKTHFYKIDAIQKERHSLGVPKGKLLPGYTPRDRDILRQLLMNLRSNEESFMLLTPNVEVEFAEVHGQLVDVLMSATHHNMMILMNVLAQFLTLGVESAGGGRSTAGAQTDIFMKALKYIANYIADVINMYLIPELVVWNFKTKNFPQLKVRDIGNTRDLQMFASGIANLFSQSAITGDVETENWLRQVFDMPAKQANAVSNVPVDPAANGDTPPANTNGKGNKGNIAQPRDKIGSSAGKAPGSAN